MDNSVKNEIPQKSDNLNSGKKKKKLIILGMGFVFLIMISIGLLSFFDILHIGIPFPKKGHSSEPEKKQDVRKIGFLYTMDPIIVNLADRDVPRYLKIRIELESHTPKSEEKVDKRLPQIRDAIITILSSKTFKEIYDREGKKKLKMEIVRMANQLLGQDKIKEIYFTEFVMQ